MSVHLALVEATWFGQAPQPGGAELDVAVLRAWKCTLGAAHALRHLEGGEGFAAWLELIVESGGGELLVVLDPLEIGELHAAWTAELRPKLAALVLAAHDHDFALSFGVRGADELERVLYAWAECIAGALGRGHGLIGMKT